MYETLSEAVKMLGDISSYSAGQGRAGQCHAVLRNLYTLSAVWFNKGVRDRFFEFLHNSNGQKLPF
jgi:hypothetical protein